VSPLAHTLLCAVRYAHGRSLHPYEEVVTTVRQVWPLLAVRDRRYWLNLVQEQVPPDLERRIADCHGPWVPVSRDELEEELKAYRSLFHWCEERMDDPVAQIYTPEAACARP
jgi:hypothetical protein